MIQELGDLGSSFGSALSLLSVDTVLGLRCK